MARTLSWPFDARLKKHEYYFNLKTLEKIEQKKVIKVGVIDTGIDDKHYIFKNTTIKKFDFSMKKDNEDDNGHGTHVSGIIKSVNPNIEIYSYKFYDPNANGQQNLHSTILALKKAVEMNVDLINYSGGGPEPSFEELQVLKEAQRKGIIVIVAAGNEKSNLDQSQNAYFPASYDLDNIIVVGAHDQEENKIISSNWGDIVDIYAPGYRIKSAIPSNGAGYMTGTSQATAFVSGYVSLLMSLYPDYDYKTIKNILYKYNRVYSKRMIGGKRMPILSMKNGINRTISSKKKDHFILVQTDLNKNIVEKENIVKKDSFKQHDYIHQNVILTLLFLGVFILLLMLFIL